MRHIQRYFSDDFFLGIDSVGAPRGKNAHVKALQPPTVQRNNIFALYVDLDVITKIMLFYTCIKFCLYSVTLNESALLSYLNTSKRS